MKNFTLSILLFFSLITLISCNNFGLSTIKGEGKTIKKEIQQADFNQIEINCEADLLIKYGPAQKITVYGQQNILDNLVFNTFNNLCEISLKDGRFSYENLTIEVVLPDINRVSLVGSGNIAINDFKMLDKLSTEITGAGDIIFNADSSKIESLSVDIAGSGNFEIQKAAVCKILTLDITGSGEIHCLPLTAETTKIDISGSGDCEVNVLKKLSIDIAGSGDVIYKGQPLINQSVTGSGSVKHLE